MNVISSTFVTFCSPGYLKAIYSLGWWLVSPILICSFGLITIPSVGAEHSALQTFANSIFWANSSNVVEIFFGNKSLAERTSFGISVKSSFWSTAKYVAKDSLALKSKPNFPLDTIPATALRSFEYLSFVLFWLLTIKSDLLQYNSPRNSLMVWLGCDSGRFSILSLSDSIR